MKIIKHKQILEDSWTHLADSDEISSGDITLSISRWKNEKNELKSHSGNIGVRLAPADNVEDITADLQNISLIALDFPAFTDGRSFSQARLLRSRYGFTGEIRAIGGFITDQVFYLHRVGVDAFELKDQDQLNAALSTMNDFTVCYQSSTN